MVITFLKNFPYLFAIAFLFKNNNLCMSLFLKTISQMKLLVLCVRGPNTPFATSFFVPNVVFVGVVFGLKKPFVAAIFPNLGKTSIVVHVLSPMKPFVVMYVPSLEAPYAIVIIYSP